MRPINFGIVGAGQFGNRILQRLSGEYGMDLSKLPVTVHLADIDESRLHATADEHGIPAERLHASAHDLPVVDAYLIATDVPSHLAVAQDLFPEGKPTFVAKPMTMPGQEQDLIRLANEHEVQAHTGSQMLAHPAFTEGLEWMDSLHVMPKAVHITWTKNRGGGKRHPVPGITVEESSHPYTLLNSIHPLSSFETLKSDVRYGLVHVDLDRWDGYEAPYDVSARHDIDGGPDTVVVEMPMATQTMLGASGRLADEYRMHASIIHDWEDPLKQRRVRIVGESAQGERFNNYVTIDMNLTDLRPENEQTLGAHVPDIMPRLLVVGSHAGNDGVFKHVYAHKRYKGTEGLVDRDRTDCLGAQIREFLVAAAEQRPARLGSLEDERVIQDFVELERESYRLGTEMYMPLRL